jgi:hypothetical protein
VAVVHEARTGMTHGSTGDTLSGASPIHTAG